jgi:hypothetical protein
MDLLLYHSLKPKSCMTFAEVEQKPLDVHLDSACIHGSPPLDSTSGTIVNED